MSFRRVAVLVEQAQLDRLSAAGVKGEADALVIAGRAQRA
jgi:hypothetical protein